MLVQAHSIIGGHQPVKKSASPQKWTFHSVCSTTIHPPEKPTQSSSRIIDLVENAKHALPLSDRQQQHAPSGPGMPLRLDRLRTPAWPHRNSAIPAHRNPTRTLTQPSHSRTRTLTSFPYLHAGASTNTTGRPPADEPAFSPTAAHSDREAGLMPVLTLPGKIFGPPSTDYAVSSTAPRGLTLRAVATTAPLPPANVQPPRASVCRPAAGGRTSDWAQLAVDAALHGGRRELDEVLIRRIQATRGFGVS